MIPEQESWSTVQRERKHVPTVSYWRGNNKCEKKKIFWLGSMSPLSGRSPFSQLQKVNNVALNGVEYMLKPTKTTTKN